MLRDFIDIDFEAIREKLVDVIYSVAGSAVDVVNDVTDAAEDAFYDLGDEPKVSLDFESFGFNPGDNPDFMRNMSAWFGSAAAK